MIKTLRELAKSIPFVRQIVVRSRTLIQNAKQMLRTNTTDALEQMVRQAAQCVDQPVFVKVGANDGLTGDPFGRSLLVNQNWKGLLIEPVPYCCDRLKRIYFDKLRFTIDQSAVGSAAGMTKFYCVAESAKESLLDLPDWYDQLGSFDRQHIVKHLDGKLEPFIVAIDVAVQPLKDILLSHNVSHVNLLHIDTEGFDLVVLKTLDLRSKRPDWIMIEHKHLSASDRSEMLSILRSAQYDVFDTGADFFAIWREASNGLSPRGRVGRVFRKTGLPLAQ